MNKELETINRVPTLNGKDRCDSGKCGARAAVKVTGLQGELFFCGHHFAKHEDALASWAFETLDERWVLDHKPGASA